MELCAGGRQTYRKHNESHQERAAGDEVEIGESETNTGQDEQHLWEDD
jgi:hypothetical protein